MANPTVSKMVTDRQRRCEFVDWFVKTYREEVTEALELVLRGDGVSEPAAEGSLTTHLDRLLRRLKRALEELIEAERVHLDEVGNDAAPRRRRDEAAAVLRKVLFDLRNLIRGAYGREKAEEIGFERRLAADPLALLRQVQRIQDHLGLPFPAPLYPGLEISSGPLLAAIEPHADELRGAIDEVNLERGKVQGTKIVKDRAMKTFDETYLQIVRVLVPSFRLAGKHKLAAQIPMSLRRRTRRKAGGAE